MRQLFLENGDIVLRDVPAPGVSGKGVIVKTAFSVVSPGTERGIIKRSRQSGRERIIERFSKENPASYLRRKIREGTLFETTKSVLFKKGIEERFSVSTRPLGYSSAGIVVAKHPKLVGVEVGDKIACCGSPHAEYNYIPANMFVKLAEEVGLKYAAFVTIGSIAMQGVRRGAIGIGDKVVVIGQGLIGLICAQILKAIGAEVAVTDVDENKLDLAKTLGIEKCVNAAKADSVSRVKKLTRGFGADAVIICAGTDSSRPVVDAVEMVRDKGRIVLVGTASIEIPREQFYEKELDFVISRSYGPGRYDRKYECNGWEYPSEYVRWPAKGNMECFGRLLAMGKVNLAPLISACCPLSEAGRLYNRLSNDSRIVGAIIEYDAEDYDRSTRKKILKKVTMEESGKGVVNLGVLGVGNFAVKYHLPNVAAIQRYNLVAAASRTCYKVDEMGKNFGAAYVTTDYKQVIEDEKIDTVLIATRHNLHASLAVEALKKGKNVFLEKPMSINEQELGMLLEAIKTSSAQFTVGFNRRYSMLSRKIKSLLAEENGPFVFNYRIAGTFSPADSWIHDPEEGGGTIIGESCHFFDLIYWLADAKPIRLFAEGGNLSHPGHDIIDNVIVTLMLDDGSTAVMTYSDRGSDGFPKEQLEIFCGGKVAVIDDFRTLKLNGFAEKTINLKEQDKGFREQLVAWSRAILDGEKGAVVSPDEAALATISTFKTIEALKTHRAQSFS